jgi:uncharacterized membrane protein
MDLNEKLAAFLFKRKTDMAEMAAPPLALTIAYWLHMVATVIWIGGLAVFSLFLIPIGQKILDRPTYAAFITQFQNRFQQIGWFCLALLIVTGMFQMSSNSSYQGFLAINNPWAVAILIKHLVIGGIILVSAYITWGLLPSMKRLALFRAAGRPVSDEQVERLNRQEKQLLWLNLILSCLVLLLTAWARSSSL